MINIKFDLSIMENYPADDWGQAQNNPQDYYKSYFMVVGLRIQNHFIKWKCGDCNQEYDDFTKFEMGYDGYSDSMLPYCPTVGCGHRVYVKVDTGDKYAQY